VFATYELNLFSFLSNNLSSKNGNILFKPSWQNGYATDLSDILKKELMLQTGRSEFDSRTWLLEIGEI
jgi:hypothetical protein